MAPFLRVPQDEDKPDFELLQHGHKDLVQAVAFNGYGDRYASGAVDGRIRVFNRHRDGTWVLCDNWSAHGGEVLELQWLPPTLYPNLLASLGIDGRFKIWAEDPTAAPGRRFGNRTSGSKAGFETRNSRVVPPAPPPGEAVADAGAGATAPHAGSTGADGGTASRATSTASSSLGTAGMMDTMGVLLGASGSDPNTTAGPTSLASGSAGDGPNDGATDSSGRPVGLPPPPLVPAPPPVPSGSSISSSAPPAPYRSFSMRHSDETRHTFLALLAADGGLAVYENEVPENLGDYSQIDELSMCARPSRGEETSFRVRFDPNPEPCYTALRAGVPPDALGLAVAAMRSAKIYRTRDVLVPGPYGAGPTTGKEFYLAVELPDHGGGLVRDIAWAPGNVRGYDVVATASQDGFVRVFRIDTPFDPRVGEHVDGMAAHRGGRSSSSWAEADIKRKRPPHPSRAALAAMSSSATATPAAAPGLGAGMPHEKSIVDAPTQQPASAPPGTSSFDLSPTPRPEEEMARPTTSMEKGSGDGVTGVPAALTTFGTESSTTSTVTTVVGAYPQEQHSSSTAQPGHGGHRAAALGEARGMSSRHKAHQQPTLLPGQVRHTATLIAKLGAHGTPVWRVGFDDDGQLLASVGDDGRLMCYRQTPGGSWAKSSELAMVRARLTVP